MPQAPQEKLPKAIEWFFKNWHTLAGLASGIVLILASGMVNPSARGLYFAAAALAVAGSLRGLLLKPTYMDLLRSNEQYEESLGNHQAALKGVIETSLRALADDLGIWRADCRISCYTHNGQAFVMLARRSDNPAYAVPGRALYPEDQGVMGVAWREGSKVETRLPVQDDRLYRQKLASEYRMRGQVVENLTMKSASLVAVRITDPRSGKHLGVIVMESTAPLGVSGGVYNRLIGSSYWRTFQELMSTSADMLPNMVEAKKKGF